MNLRITLTLSVPIDPKNYGLTDDDLADLREVDVAEDVIELETKNHSWDELAQLVLGADDTELSLAVTGDGAPQLGCNEQILATGTVPKP